MSGFARGVGLGAGLVTLGWGVYRFTRGKRDWMTTTSLTTGASLLLANLDKTRPRTLTGQVTHLMGTVGKTMGTAARLT